MQCHLVKKIFEENGIVFHRTRFRSLKNIAVLGSKKPRQVPMFLKGPYEITIPFSNNMS